MPKQKATFQPTVRPDWAGAMEYIPEQEQIKIFQAILMFPAIDLPDSAFWNKTIKPDLQNQYETFIASCEKKAIGIRKRWETTKSIDNYTNVLDKNTTEQDMIYIVKDKDKYKDKNKVVSEMLSSIGKENTNSILIDSNFSCSKFDVFKTYINEMPSCVIQSVENWLKKQKNGQTVPVGFITKQFINFANRQNKPLFKGEQQCK
jgi:hypothetical protein